MDANFPNFERPIPNFYLFIFCLPKKRTKKGHRNRVKTLIFQDDLYFPSSAKPNGNFSLFLRPLHKAVAVPSHEKGYKFARISGLPPHDTEDNFYKILY
jgi:hypothetical protein